MLNLPLPEHRGQMVGIALVIAWNDLSGLPGGIDALRVAPKPSLRRLAPSERATPRGRGRGGI